ncbi:MAG TPA: hypothetical protein DIT93_00310 [Pelagibacterium sp.]|uniref:hypothetical protein n=1 Tax=uncultured Pelagibacterium sp. TaxID=1159875 RepID=UPI000EDAB743|nr:hypothetical protein [Pelagibacterium sp.]|tara:strand:- start:246 stop:635 length:390 start_codon:yes stop_codon:yes gene_type:complete
MKMIAIVCDGAGAFHCACVKNPDLFRRDIAAKTGAGFIAWAGTPIHGTSPQSLIANIERSVLPRFIAGPALQHDLHFTIAMGWVVFGKPLAVIIGAKIVRSVWRMTSIAMLWNIGRRPARGTIKEVGHD